MGAADRDARYDASAKGRARRDRYEAAHRERRLAAKREYMRRLRAARRDGSK